jgi:cell wall-associated NlpC family hydrolase
MNRAVRRLLTLALVILFPAAVLAVDTPRYAVARLPTPVFSIPDIRGLFGGEDGASLRLDRCGQLRSLEFVALPGTVFDIEAVVPAEPAPVYRVRSAEYPYPSPGGYFIDARFVDTAGVRPVERPRRLPEKEAVIADLLSAVGSRYVWGGNRRRGIPELLRFYPPRNARDLTGESRELWQLRGVDCSGLLYEATAGSTPRNTSALTRFGRGVPIAGLGAAEIASRLEPLDLIVWNGHVLIVIDRTRVIESRLACGAAGGVAITPLSERLSQIMKTRQPVDDYTGNGEAGRQTFVVRRWYEQARAGAERAQ